MDQPANLSVRNRGLRPEIQVNSTGVELRSIPPPGSPTAESVSNISNPSGHIEVRRQSTSISRNRDFAEYGINDYDSGSQETVVLRSLRTWDVAALIINKMVGTGIFTTPGVVLSLTGSKTISIILWLVGGVHTLLCLTVYLEFGAALPYTGGELIYLDEMYYRPELLATILFSGFFICFGTSASNSIAFARYVMLAAEPQVQNEGELDKRLIGFIAITINFVTCLLLYFSSGLALALNRISAVYKIILMLIVFIAGAAASTKQDSGVHDFENTHGSSSTETLAALVYILFAYQGWENANYVAGEIRAPKTTLRNGAGLAVLLVTSLYILVTLGLFGTPAGALILHGVFTTVMIIVTVAARPSPDAYNLVLAIYTYGHVIVSTLVGASAFWIEKRLSSRPQGWKPQYIKSPFIRRVLATLFIGMNMVILVEAGRVTTHGEIPRYWWPAISGIIVAGSFVYWGGLRILMLPNPFTAWRLRHEARGNSGRGDSAEEPPVETVGQALFGVNIKILYEGSPQYYQDDIECFTFGLRDESRRRISYAVSLKRSS
ncbi:Low-affinity methionine permease [Talaromyces islandicus]|uniref:Low-affinity methionine permease n=1 Tax=Talaromyces islandicus TaxID=28573 RepID=A0A0U1M765_TALIS|nr:Low-affinity methionine permease [Talaromyces islandicus]